jgi:hypothetical protein
MIPEAVQENLSRTFQSFRSLKIHELSHKVIRNKEYTINEAAI